MAFDENNPGYLLNQSAHFLKCRVDKNEQRNQLFIEHNDKTEIPG